MTPDKNVSGDFHHCVFDLCSFSLDPYQRHPLSHPLPSAFPQSSNPAYIDYRLGGPFTQVLCHRPSSMSLSRRVDWYACLILSRRILNLIRLYIAVRRSGCSKR